MDSPKRYSWNAEDYTQHSHVQQVWARELIGKLTLEGREVLLDIGCGDGKVTAEIAGHLPGGRVVGIDSSEAMIASARARFPREKFPNLSFEHGDARSLSYQARFDIIFSNAALHWIKDHGPVIKGIKKASNPMAVYCCKWAARAMPRPSLLSWMP